MHIYIMRVNRPARTRKRIFVKRARTMREQKSIFDKLLEKNPGLMSSQAVKRATRSAFKAGRDSLLFDEHGFARRGVQDAFEEYWNRAQDGHVSAESPPPSISSPVSPRYGVYVERPESAPRRRRGRSRRTRSRRTRKKGGQRQLGSQDSL
jgi:hypothetical protein